MIWEYTYDVLYEFSRMPEHTKEYREEISKGMRIDQQLNRLVDKGYEIFYLTKNPQGSWTVILRKPKL